ncbi:MAG: pyridoxal 5'-phosphate synthase glutaminase subunit PdxT [Candidatus Methanomethylicia archaeon]|nr:pyridoxal 5'-phosphate synthase glutaminase subunit PdxT [Candidatus Methanomethylicia archaeon]
MIIGILSYQGAIEEHLKMTKIALESMKINGEVKLVKKYDEIKEINGLIIPGGESTTIGKISSLNQTIQLIKQRIYEGMPVLGTCAGLILLAKRVYDRVIGEVRQSLIGVMDITIERNAFGRQRESFEADLEIPIIGEKKFRGVFIRAPVIREVGPNVEVLSRLGNLIVAVKQGSIIGTAFHPELTDDPRIHQFFIKEICNRLL